MFFIVLIKGHHHAAQYNDTFGKHVHAQIKVSEVFVDF